MPPEPFWLQRGQLHIVPICHYKLEFAVELGRVLQAVGPRHLALELPPFLLEPLQQAVARLPRLTTLAFAVGDGQMLLPVEPTDPFVEAVRWARARDCQLHGIDAAVVGYGQHHDPIPDSCSLTAIGLQAFWQEWSRHPGPRPDAADQERHLSMVHSLKFLEKRYPDEPIVVALGLTHVRPVLELLASEAELPLPVPSLTRPPEVVLYQPDLRSTREASLEMGWIMALFELSRGGPGPDETWLPPPEPPDETSEDLRESLKDLKPDQLVASLESMLGGIRRRPPPLPPQQKRALSRYLQGLQEQPAALFSLLHQIGSGDRIELPKVKAPPKFKAFTFRQVHQRRHQLQGIYAAALERAGPRFDRQEMLHALVEHAGRFYQENTGDFVRPWQLQVLYQFTRNYARLRGRLLPNLYELVMGARGVADDNLSYEIWDLGSFYPWTVEEGESCDLPLLELRADQLFLGGQAVQHWTFHRKLPGLRMRMPIQGQRGREKSPGDWSESFEDGTLCSYPPEDLVIEDYARYLQKKAIQQLSLEKARIEPFTTSLLDGIEMRETLRNWHEKKLYVHESRRVRGGVGAVVLIFDEDPDDRRYPWRMTWHGEHAQESDMAFYATPIQQKIVGPGIARCEYGGILMTYPHRRLGDIWAEGMYRRECRNKSEVLLMAAIDYGLDPHIVYVASKPPRSLFRTLASRVGKKIVYLPVGSLSPQSIQRIRVFHVLSGHQIRKVAKDYIW